MTTPFPPRDPGPAVYYVYGYFEPGSEKPFYIGKGKGRRAKSHLKAAEQGKEGGLFYVRLRELASQGITPDVRLLHEDLTDDEAKDKEIWLISRWGRIDIGTGCLCNHTDGGDGASGMRHSAETLAKKSAINTGKMHSDEAKARMRSSSPNKAPVESYDLDTGETVKRYASLSEACEDGFRLRAIRFAVSNRRKSHGGLGWRYTNPGRANVLRIPTRQARPVESYDPLTGEAVKRYPSARSTSEDGFTPQHVTGVVNGHRPLHGTLGWRYAS